MDEDEGPILFLVDQWPWLQKEILLYHPLTVLQSQVLLKKYLPVKGDMQIMLDAIYANVSHGAQTQNQGL